MLKKLLKYDLKAMLPWYLMVGIILLGVSCLSRLFLLLSDLFPGALMTVPYATLTAFFTLGLNLSLIVASAFPAIRYYRNLICDEGYLMFTLPVSREQLYFSKLLSSLIGTALLGLFDIASVGIAFLTTEEGIQSVQSALAFIGEFLAESISIGEWIWLILLILVGLPLLLVTEQTKLFLCLNLGQLAKNHKLLYSFLAYCALGMVTSMVSGIVSFTGLLFSVDELETVSVLGYGTLYLGIYLVLFVAETLISLRILNKHLNLE